MMTVGARGAYNLIRSTLLQARKAGDVVCLFHLCVTAQARRYTQETMLSFRYFESNP